MKMEIVLAGLLIGAGIAVGGFANRFEIQPNTQSGAWQIDGLTGSVKYCILTSFGTSLADRLSSSVEQALIDRLTSPEPIPKYFRCISE